MLRNTFCHIPGVGLKTERGFWSQGIRSWEDVLSNGSVEGPGYKTILMKTRVIESLICLERGDPVYFADNLPVGELWRLFGDFKDSVAYLDIETSPMRKTPNGITTIAMYDGKNIFHYVRGQNLVDFVEDIQKYKVIVTYNGKSFDIPVIEKSFRIRIKQPQIDLRYLLKSLGYTGGLKGCEKKLGLDRHELDGVDGYFAVLFWHDFRKNNNRKALETLLAYNILDAVNLHQLMVMAYNLKLQETPFFDEHRLAIPAAVQNPFEADMDTINRIRDEQYTRF